MIDLLRLGASPVEHGEPGNCLLCNLVDRVNDWPDWTNWHVVGERVIRGRCLIKDMWRYVLVGADGVTLVRCLDVTDETLLSEGGHEAALRKLAGGAS